MSFNFRQNGEWVQLTHRTRSGDRWVTAAGGPGAVDVPMPEDATTISTSESVADVLEGASAGSAYRLEQGTHQASRQIFLEEDGVTVVIPDGATLRVYDGVSEAESFLNVRANNITLMGNGIIDGNRENSAGLGADPPASHGHEHIVHVGHHSISQISGFILDGLTLQNAPGGDGIYVVGVDDCRVQNFLIDRAYRNGISCIDLSNATFTEFVVRDTQGTAPQSGIAFEPNSEGQVMDGVTIANGETINNDVHGLYINNHFTDQQQGSSTIDIDVTNVTASRNGLQGFSLHGTSGSESIVLSGCEASKNARAGFYVAGSGNVEVVDCAGLDNGQNGDNNNHEVGVTGERDMGDNAPADFVVRNFEVRGSNTQKHPGTALHGSTIRIEGATVGGHTHSEDGFRAAGTGSLIEYSNITVESGDRPAFGTGGGSVSQI